MTTALIIGDVQTGLVETFPCATSGVVLATLIDVTERDYGVTVLRDGCADAETEVHDFLINRVFPGRGAQVVNCRDWIEGLKNSQGPDTGPSA